MQLIDSVDYLDHVSCTNTDNFGLYGINNDTIYSLNGNTRFVMQNDGNVVLSKRINSSSNWIIKWHTNISSNYTATATTPGLFIQRDGNVVLYLTMSPGSGWQSDTWSSGKKPYHFVVSDNGCAYLLDDTQSIHYSLPIADCNTSTPHPTYALLPTLYPTNNPTTGNPTNTPTLYATKNPTTPTPTNNPITSRPTTTNCDHYFPETIEIALNQTVGFDNIIIRDVMEVSLDLRLNESCPTEYCHLLHIGTEWHQRLPLINIPSNTGGLQVVFSDSEDHNSNYKVTNSSLASALIDGLYHSLYFKWSPWDRIFIFDNITYKNELNGWYNFSQYVNNEYPLHVVDAWSPYIIKGDIKNLCIKSTILTSIQTTITPTTIIPTTIRPTTIIPTTSTPTTAQPTSMMPTTTRAPSIFPTTAVPTTNIPTFPTTSSPTLSPITGYWTSWYGVENGSYYELSTVDGYHITKICTKYGAVIDNIEVDFNNGVHSGPYGGSDGSGPYCYDLNNYTINADYDCFTSLRAGIGQAVDSLQFFTSIGGNTFPWGGTGGTIYNISSSHAGDCITKIGVRTNGLYLLQIRLFFHPPVTRSPTVDPTHYPTTFQPTTLNPTAQPTALNSTDQPTTFNPTDQPTFNPTLTAQPTTLNPTAQPTALNSTAQSISTTLNPTPNGTDLVTMSTTNIMSEVRKDDKEELPMIFGIIGGVVLLIVLIILGLVIPKNKGNKSRASIDANNIEMGIHGSPNKVHKDSFDKLYDVLMSSTSNENNNAFNYNVTEGKEENINNDNIDNMDHNNNNDNAMYGKSVVNSIITEKEDSIMTPNGDVASIGEGEILHSNPTVEGDQDDSNEMIADVVRTKTLTYNDDGDV